MVKEKLSVAEIRDALPQFIGTENYYKFSILSRLVLTDGTKFLADACQCYWLMDIVSSYQGKKLEAKTEGFQVWTLKVDKTKEDRKFDAFVTCDDGNGNVCVKQNIPYTDFPLDTIKLYCSGGVILLPSEY